MVTSVARMRCVACAVENAPGADLAAAVVHRCTFIAHAHQRSWVGPQDLDAPSPPLRAHHPSSQSGGFADHVRPPLPSQVAIRFASHCQGVTWLSPLDPSPPRMDCSWARSASPSRAWQRCARDPIVYPHPSVRLLRGYHPGQSAATWCVQAKGE